MSLAPCSMMDNCITLSCACIYYFLFWDFESQIMIVKSIINVFVCHIEIVVITWCLYKMFSFMQL